MVEVLFRKMNKEKLTSSEAAHRRQVLAEERRTLLPDYLTRRIIDTVQAERRLVEVGNLLEREDGLAPSEKASLKIEEIWLEFRLERITQAERQSRLQRLLNRIEEEEPKIYSWLIDENENGSTPLARIRDSVLPSVKVGGYHTKRRRRKR